MNKTISFILLAIMGLIGFSCNDDLLNTKPLDKYTESDVWNDQNLTQGFIYATYQSVLPELLVNPKDPDPKGGGVGSDDLTDNILTGKSNPIARDQIDKYFDAGWATNNSYYWFGKAPLSRKGPIKKNSFEVIRDCNLIIENVTKSEGIPEVVKPELIAQGKMLRALIYYSKARLFGKYVIVDHVLTQEDELKLPRTTTIKETYDFIVKDLQEAAVDLPATADAGHFTQGAAYAMLAEIALHGAAYIETGKADYYAIAQQASEDLFTLNYQLEADYAGLFNDYDKALASKEIILAQYKHMDATQCVITSMQRLVPNMEVAKTSGLPKLKYSYLGWTLCWPTCDLVDDYLVTDVDGIAKKWDATQYYADYSASTDSNLFKAIYNEHRDQRFFASIVSDSSEFLGNTICMRVGGNMHPDMSKKGTNASTRSGYYVRKGIYPIVGYKNNVYTAYHHTLTRLGRAYLNYAEVMLRLNKTDIAIDYINMTRTTHGGLSALNTGLSNDEVWKWYKIERRVELFMENDRYWSLLRWGKEEGLAVVSELNDKQHTFFEIDAKGKAYTFETKLIGGSTHEKRFSEKRYLFPVPQGERDLNDALDQNPNWN